MFDLYIIDLLRDLESRPVHEPLCRVAVKVIRLIAENDLHVLSLAVNIFKCAYGSIGESIEALGGHIGVPKQFLRQECKKSVEKYHRCNKHAGEDERYPAVAEAARMQCVFGAVHLCRLRSRPTPALVNAHGQVKENESK